MFKEYFSAHAGMVSHDYKFFFTEVARFEKYLSGNLALADIMEECGGAKLKKLLITKAEIVTDKDSQGCHPN